MTRRTNIAEISNIPSGGINRWTGSKIGSVTFITKEINAFLENTNHEAINRIKINSTSTLNKP